MILGAFELNPRWPTQHVELRPVSECLFFVAVRLSDIYPLKKKEGEKREKNRFALAVINKQRKGNRNKVVMGEVCVGGATLLVFVTKEGDKWRIKMR